MNIPNHLRGVGLLYLGNPQTGQWIPNGFWYDSKIFGQSTIQCIICSRENGGEQKFYSSNPYQCLSLSNLQHYVSSLRLMKLNDMDDTNFRNLIYTFISSKFKNSGTSEVTTSEEHCDLKENCTKTILDLVKKYVHCSIKEINSKKIQTTLSKTLERGNKSEQIDDKLDKIRKHLDKLRIEKTNDKKFSTRPEIIPESCSPDIILDLNKFEREYFSEVYTYFK